MDRHWDNYCTMSIVHFMAFPEAMGGDGPIADSLGAIAVDPFFGGVEVTSVNSREEREALKNIVDASNLKVGFAAQPVILMRKFSLSSLDPAESETTVSLVKGLIDEAAGIGADRVALYSGPDPGDANRPAALNALIQSTKELCAYALERGISISCETFDRAVDKKALIGPSELAREYAAAVCEEYPNFGLMYDLSHQPLLYEEPEEALALLQPYLVHVHVGNCVRDEGVAAYGDLHPRFGWPGGCNGVAELARFIRALFEIGYLADGKKERPWVGFEVRPQSDKETSAQIIAGSKRCWQEAWARV